jgi:predicted phosphodiesterase
MRIQVLSDIHTEFHTDSGEQFVTEYLRPKGVDVLIIAGDIGVGKSLSYSLDLIAKHYENASVLYVPGNHDFYNSNFPEILNQLRILEDAIDNLFILNNRMVTVDGVNFVGSPLWFRKKKDYQAYSSMLNDFNLIENFEEKVFKENRKSLNFLNWHVNADSIVITHHVPTEKSTPARYVGDPLNMFFLCNMEKLIKERKPKLWVHGHTHDSFNYMLEKTHIVCNPLGYLGHQVNAEFLPNMMVEL